jgi:hypothetical protein
MKTITSLLLIIVSISACSKKYSCSDPEISIGFIASPIEDIDTIILRKFVANSNFQTLIDTIGIYRDINSLIRVFASGDTAIITLFNSQNSIRPGFDWQIFNPATKKTYAISDIEKEDTEIKCATFNTDCFCDDIITRISINNQNAIPNNFRLNRIFLRQ